MIRFRWMDVFGARFFFFTKYGAITTNGGLFESFVDILLFVIEVTGSSHILNYMDQLGVRKAARTGGIFFSQLPIVMKMNVFAYTIHIA